MTVTAILFWDIDGTLLTTGRAGIFAWEDAAAEAAGRPVDLQEMRTAGLTDYEVGTLILSNLGLPPNGDTLTRLVRRYEEQLPPSLRRRQGQVLPGVRELLDALAGRRPDVRSYLLTGNTRAGAHAKLTYYGLAGYFRGGAFASGVETRSAIARRGLDLVNAERTAASDRVFVIGDTPHDISCGRAIGARTIAVASGDYSVADLREHGPWRVIPRVPAPGEFVTMLEEEIE